MPPTQTQKKGIILQSIDEKHNELMSKFADTETGILPQLVSERHHLKHKLSNVALKHDARFDLKDKLNALNRRISDLKSQKDRYLLENSKYLFQYFEEKKSVSNGNNTQNTDALRSFFRIKTNANVKIDPDPESADPNSHKYAQSKAVLNMYWKNVNNNIINMQNYVVPSDICEKCNAGELIPQDEEGILICNNMQCGKFITHIVDSAKPANKEPPNEVSYTAYVRLNHFKEILSQFQAKETTQIPAEVVKLIRNRIKKERITDISTINYDKMREILRKLGLNKYFEHIQYINSLLGIQPPIMSESLHNTLCVLFIEIQKPWALHCPPDRSNFFNYTYTLYQLCVLLDQTQYLPFIPMMKDREKQLEQDMTWKLVCNDLDWEFFPTV